ncbi:MAG: hypothetical protein GEU81_04435 [Nitriliruptorales bacterium]|nr:hypothetical protein [Nitriliruptorales bacterium]
MAQTTPLPDPGEPTPVPDPGEPEPIPEPDPEPMPLPEPTGPGSRIFPARASPMGLLLSW